MKKTTDKIFESLALEGDKKFLAQTQKAIRLLKTKTPKEFRNIVLPHVAKIKSHKSSGMNLWAKVPTYEVGKETAFYSLKWYASTIVHDAYHAKLYFDYKKKHKGAVPAKIYKSQAAELKCLKVQISAAKKLKMPKADIDYLKSLDGGHAKLARVNW